MDYICHIVHVQLSVIWMQFCISGYDGDYHSEDEEEGGYVLDDAEGLNAIELSDLSTAT